jgi:hypothetical protein
LAKGPQQQQVNTSKTYSHGTFVRGAPEAKQSSREERIHTGVYLCYRQPLRKPSAAMMLFINVTTAFCLLISHLVENPSYRHGFEIRMAEEYFHPILLIRGSFVSLFICLRSHSNRNCSTLHAKSRRICMGLCVRARARADNCTVTLSSTSFEARFPFYSFTGLDTI